LKKKIIVVSGGAGFIGSNLIKFLLKKTNFRIISIDNYSSGSIKNHIKDTRVKYIYSDIKQISKILNFCKKKIITIFHFGEFSRIHESFKNIDSCINYNLCGTNEVFRFCLKNKIKVIYSATSASLGNNGKDKILSPYALTKSNNLELLNFLNKWFGLKYEILYFYNVYGPGQIETGKMATVIGIFQNQYKRNEPLTVVKPGNQSRKFTHIDDVVDGCYHAFKKNLNRHYAIFNNKSYSIIEVAKMFNRKIILIEKKLGERFKSAIVNKSQNIKIYKIKCKISLKKYISDFLIKN